MEFLKKNLSIIKNNLMPKDMDWLHVNVGYERSGKSNLALLIAMFMDDDFDVKRVTFTAKEFKKAVDRAKPYQCIMADEGAESFFSKDAMKAENVENIRLLTKIGAKRLFIIINVPDFFLLDTYVRGHRVRSMCRVMGRGSFAFYNKSKIAEIKRNNDNRSTIYPSEPNFFDNFYKLADKKGREGIIWNAYLKKKMDYLNKRTDLDKMQAKAEEMVVQTFSCAEVARMLHVKPMTFHNWVVKKKVKTIKNIMGRRRIPKSEVERLLNFYGKQTKKIEDAFEKADNL